MMLLLLLALILLVVGAAFAFFFLQLKGRTGRAAKEPVDLPDERLKECAKCGKRRIIINAGLCATCWSSQGTKELN